MKLETYNNVNTLALKMLINNNGLDQLMEKRMRDFLVNKNLCLYYRLKKKIGKKLAFGVAITLEKAILIFGREGIPYFDKNEMPTEQEGSVLKSIYGEK